ncbi:MAG: hypothetical protein HYZ20_15975 [Burkholderiales bacterium]|nr:hypothetical protein [Burkholderiales bacterium]
MFVRAAITPATGSRPARRPCLRGSGGPLRRGLALLGRLGRAGLSAAGLLLAAAPASAQLLTLHYQERPPYSSAGADGQVRGLLATPAARALTAAGIRFAWVDTPGQRQLALIQAGRGLHCGLGWFRNDERAAQGKFSRALYRDRGFVALARRDAGLPPSIAAPELIADRRLRLLVKEGYSYGAELDALIDRLVPTLVRTSVEPLQLLRMLRSGRADWTIATAEDAALHVDAMLVAVTLKGLAGGPTRHLYCSGELPDDWLARIDAALAAAGEAADGVAGGAR